MPTPKEGYYIKDGTRVPSVTQITGRYGDKSSLIPWARKQGYQQAQAGMPLNHNEKSAAEIGTVVHAMVEAKIKGINPLAENTLTEEAMWKKAEQSYASFEYWWGIHRPEMLHTELRLVSEKYKFGGTLDGIGLIGGLLVLLDWKTSSGIYPEYVVQVAGYKIAWEENNPDKPLKGFHILRISKESGHFTHKGYINLGPAEQQFIYWRKSYENEPILKEMAK